MPIDQNRLRNDPTYWDEVAPAHATHWAPSRGTYAERFYEEDPDNPGNLFTLHVRTHNRCRYSRRPSTDLIPRPTTRRTIDILRMAFDRNYWREVGAPEDATHWGPPIPDQPAMGVTFFKMEGDHCQTWMHDHWGNPMPMGAIFRPLDKMIPHPTYEDTGPTNPWFWREAPVEATHWDRSIVRFCNAQGFWGSEGFHDWGDRSADLQNATTQFIPRPQIQGPDPLLMALCPDYWIMCRAPEDATHWGPDGSYTDGFYRFEGDTKYYCNPYDQTRSRCVARWNTVSGCPSDLIPRPATGQTILQIGDAIHKDLITSPEMMAQLHALASNPNTAYGQWGGFSSWTHLVYGRNGYWIWAAETYYAIRQFVTPEQLLSDPAPAEVKPGTRWRGRNAGNLVKIHKVKDNKTHYRWVGDTHIWVAHTDDFTRTYTPAP